MIIELLFIDPSKRRGYGLILPTSYPVKVRKNTKGRSIKVYNSKYLQSEVKLANILSSTTLYQLFLSKHMIVSPSEKNPILKFSLKSI